MSCLFSCFRNGDGYGAGDSTLRSRRVLVRTSTEKQSFSYSQSSAQDAAVLADEKVALNGRDMLMDDFDEDAEERSLYISEKQLEAGFEEPLQVNTELVLTRRLTKKSAGWRWRRPKGAEATLLLQQNTTDEMHRQAEFETYVKKLKGDAVKRAWAAENERREKWKTERRNAKQR